MKKLLMIAIIILITSNVYAVDDCTLLGDHAVMIAQWKQAGKSYSSALSYFDGVGYKGSRFQALYKVIAETIYTTKGEKSPRYWRLAIEGQCKEESGAR